jgi:hypothetical protein
MLTAAGFQPEFVLGSAEPAIDALSQIVNKFPLPNEFQSVLVKIGIENESYFLNDTDQYARLGATAHDGCLGITLANQKLGTITAVNGAKNQLATNYHITLDDSGKVKMEIRHAYSGAGYGEKHKFFAELPPEERKRYFQEAVSKVAQGARPVGDLMTKFDEYPGIEQFTVEIDHYAVVDGKYLYLDLPYTLHLFPTYTDRHTLPLLIRSAQQQTVQTKIELPKGFRRVAIAPQNQNILAPCGAGKVLIAAKAKEQDWSVIQDLSANPSLITPENYPELLAEESALENKSSRLLLLEH